MVRFTTREVFSQVFLDLVLLPELLPHKVGSSQRSGLPSQDSNGGLSAAAQHAGVWVQRELSEERWTGTDLWSE